MTRLLRSGAGGDPRALLEGGVEEGRAGLGDPAAREAVPLRGAGCAACFGSVVVVSVFCFGGVLDGFGSVQRVFGADGFQDVLVAFCVLGQLGHTACVFQLSSNHFA